MLGVLNDLFLGVCPHSAHSRHTINIEAVLAAAVCVTRAHREAGGRGVVAALSDHAVTSLPNRNCHESFKLEGLMKRLEGMTYRMCFGALIRLRFKGHFRNLRFTLFIASMFVN